MATPERRDPELLKVWISRDWEALYPGTKAAAFRQSFREHLDALLEEDLNPVPVADARLVAQARQALVQLPLASRVYAQLKAEQHAERTDGWTLAEFVPADDLRFFRRKSGAPFTDGVPRLYTVDGYQQVFVSQREALVEQAVEEAWVLGPSPSRARADEERAALERKVEELYLADYVRLWEAFLGDIEVPEENNVELQADLVRAMMQPDSPAKAVLTAIAGQTALSRAIAAREQGEQDPREIQRFRDRVERWLSRADPAASQLAAGGFADPALKVDQRFRQLHAVVFSDGKSPPRIDAVLSELSELYDLLVEFLHQKTLGPDEIQGVNERVSRGNAVIGRIESLANAQPLPLQGWLKSMADAGRSKTVGKVAAGVEQQVKEAWASSAGPECIAALSGRYPFDRSSTLPVTLNDFARVLGPDGTIDRFAQTYVTPFADTSVRPWRWRRDATVKGMSTGALRMFEQAAAIRQAFFASGALGFGLEVEPVSLDHRARQVTLEVGDKRVTYQHGPRRPTRIQWPPEASGARVTFTTRRTFSARRSPPARAARGASSSFSTPLSCAAAAGRIASARCSTSGAIGRSSRSAPTASSTPSSMPELEQFRCLERL